MASVLRIIAEILKRAWRWGVSQVNRAVDWVRSNWQKVAKWVAQGLSLETIIYLICINTGLLC